MKWARLARDFFGENLYFPKIKKLNFFVRISEPAQKCENYASFMQIYTLKLFIALKWPILALPARGKSRFSIIPPKKFYNINYRALLSKAKGSNVATYSPKWVRMNIYLIQI